jgi:hypothetical protein
MKDSQQSEAQLALSGSIMLATPGSFENVPSATSLNSGILQRNQDLHISGTCPAVKVVRAFESHSCRKVLAGSTFAIFRAGRIVANKVTSKSVSTTAVRVITS